MAFNESNFKELISKAEQGSRYHLRTVGHHFYSKQMYNEAIRWFTKAYDKNISSDRINATSAHLIGMCYEEKGGEDDYNKAYEWYKLAAGNGYGDAAYRLGEMFENGVYIYNDEYVISSTVFYPDDYLAAKWFIKAGELDNVDGMYKCSFIYRHGKGVLRSYIKAFDWMLKSACYKYTSKKSSLGLSGYFYEGIGVKENKYEAYVWAVIAGDYYKPEAFTALESELSKKDVLCAQREAEKRISISLNMDQREKNLYAYMRKVLKNSLQDTEEIAVKEIKDENNLEFDDHNIESISNDIKGSETEHERFSEISGQNPEDENLYVRVYGVIALHNKRHRSGLDYSSWKVDQLKDIKLTLYLRDANITLSYKNKKDTQPADKLFSVNSLRLLILAYDFLKKGHSAIRKTENTIASAAYPNKDMADCIPNNRVVTYFNSDFRKLFGLAKKDKAFDWDGGKFNSHLVANFTLEVKP